VIRIQSIEEDLTRDALERADRVPLLDRIKGFISELSSGLQVQILAREPVRSERGSQEQPSYTLDTPLILLVQAPADGYLTIFHVCEKKGVVKLVFPLLETDDPFVQAGKDLGPIHGKVDGPSGNHFFKAFWTRANLLELVQRDRQREGDEEEVADLFLKLW
jgi:hypothetical protein